MTCNKVAIGGTFDRLHIGHKKLIDTALSLGCNEIVIGVVSDDLIKNKALSSLIKPFEERVKIISSYVSSRLRGSRFRVVELRDPYGPTIYDPSIDVIVVSEETLPRAIEINLIRERRGLKPLKIVVVEIVKAEDGRPLRATRVRLSEVDKDGRLLTRLLTPALRGVEVEGVQE